MKEMKVLNEKQQNSFYNESQSRNGGGYNQPLIKFEFYGIEGVVNDTSCGDFGERFTVKWDGKTYRLNQVDREKSEYSSFDECDRDFIEALVNKLGYLVLTKWEVEND